MNATTDTLRDVTRLVVQHRVNCIPVTGKVAAGPWKRWQSQHQYDLPHPQLHEWLGTNFDCGGNVAAITGAISGIVVVDVDSLAAAEAFETICDGKDSGGPMVRTAKGGHWWFAHPGVPVRNKARLDGVELDVRGDGGYCLIPPSIHPSGKPYLWWRSPDRCWPPPQLPDALLAMLNPRQPQQRQYTRSPNLERRLASVRNAPAGQRNDVLNSVVYAIAGDVVDGRLRAQELVDHALTAAVAAGLPADEALRTIDSAMESRRR